MSETSFINEKKLGVGEILICNKQTKGKFEQLKHFIGKQVSTIGGGGDKIYVVETNEKGESEVKSIQSKIEQNNSFLKTDVSNLPVFTSTENNNNTTPNNEDPTKLEEKKQEENFKQEYGTSLTNTQSNEEQVNARIIQICKGKYHLIKLTSDGKVRCSGKSYFGIVGLGGSASSETTKLLPNLANIKVIQVACGEFHSLALAENGDLYTWGIGFEG